MSETVKWEDVEDPIERCFMETREQAETEAGERSLKRARDIIMNPEYRKRAIKVSKDVLAKQAEILERGGNPADPAEYDDDDDYDDDDYDADEWYLDDECYPDDE